MKASSIWMPTTSPITISTVPIGPLPGRRTVEWYMHSNCTGARLTRHGPTRIEGAFSRPASANSSVPDGQSIAVILTCSRSSQVAMFHTNSRVASALTTESLRCAPIVWFDENIT
jgi:hypothetical protein